jgi:hypothetical protein
MSAMETAIRTALRANVALLAAAPGGVHQDVAPKAVSQPFVIYTLMSAPDDYTLAPSDRCETCRYLLKAVAPTITAADAIADLIDTVLATPLTITGLDVIDQVRTERVSYKDITVEGQDWWHRGGIYLIEVQA